LSLSAVIDSLLPPNLILQPGPIRGRLIDQCGQLFFSSSPTSS
jgi:hypothetical protein